MAKNRKNLLEQNIDERLKKAKHEYKTKKQPVDAGTIITAVVIAGVVIAIILSATQMFNK